MITDFHTHCFPDKVAEKAMPKLAGTSGIKNQSDGTVADTLKKLDECGIDRAVVCNIATNPRQMTNVNNFAIELLRTQTLLIPLGSINPDNDAETVKAELTRLHDAGIKGIKIHPDYMGYSISEDCWKPVFAACSELDMFVISHAGWDFISPDHIAAPPYEIRKVIDDYPDLRFIAAHFGGNRMWDDVERYLVGRHIWFDTAHCEYENIDRKTAARIIMNHHEDKVLFGSDLPWSSPRAEADMIMSLDIPDERKAKIMSENAAKLLGGH